MRVMVLVKATEDSEQGFKHTAEEQAMMEAMGKFNDDLAEAGVLVFADGLQPSSAGRRVAFDGPSRTVRQCQIREQPRTASRQRTTHRSARHHPSRALRSRPPSWPARRVWPLESAV